MNKAQTDDKFFAKLEQWRTTSVPSEKSRYLFKELSPATDVDRNETLAVLESRGSRAIAEMLWQRSEIDQSLRHQFAVMVLRSRLSTAPDEEEVKDLLEQLMKLCEFEAEWRERDSGWARFLAEVVSTVEILLVRTHLDSIRSQIGEIIQVAEESTFQIDDCYSCSLEIERLERILSGKK